MVNSAVCCQDLPAEGAVVDLNLVQLPEEESQGLPATAALEALLKGCPYVCSKLSKALFFLKRAKHFISKTALKSLYFALFHPHLLYCINITSCANQSLLNKITVLQKKAIRILTNSHYHAHTKPLFENLDILTFELLCTQQKLIFMHSIKYNYAHISFHGMWTKNEDRNLATQLRNNDDFYLPSVHIEQFKKIPLYSFPQEWNKLGDLKFQKILCTFNTESKYKLRENSLSQLTIIE